MTTNDPIQKIIAKAGGAAAILSQFGGAEAVAKVVAVAIYQANLAVRGINYAPTLAERALGSADNTYAPDPNRIDHTSVHDTPIFLYTPTTRLRLPQGQPSDVLNVIMQEDRYQPLTRLLEEGIQKFIQAECPQAASVKPRFDIAAMLKGKLDGFRGLEKILTPLLRRLKVPALPTLLAEINQGAIEQLTLSLAKHDEQDRPAILSAVLSRALSDAAAAPTGRVTRPPKGCATKTR